MISVFLRTMLGTTEQLLAASALTVRDLLRPPSGNPECAVLTGRSGRAVSSVRQVLSSDLAASRRSERRTGGPLVASRAGA